MRVSVAVALGKRQEVIEVELPRGATIAEAIAAARIAERFPELRVDALQAGVWSRVADRATRLRAGDRVELYRPLKADPKSLRRTRARLRPSPRSRSGP
jgi:hypothetical protein